jgi:hypothetical protein
MKKKMHLRRSEPGYRTALTAGISAAVDSSELGAPVLQALSRAGAGGEPEPPYGGGSKKQNLPARISAARRLTVPSPAPLAVAVFRTEAPSASILRIAAMVSAGNFGRPIGLPLLVPCTVHPRLGHTGTNPRHDDRSLKLGENPEHLKHRLSGWHAGVDPLPIEVEVAFGTVHLAEERDEIL